MFAPGGLANSRAQCLAVLVHNPRLLDADGRTLDAMDLVNGVCRYVEMACEQQAADTVDHGRFGASGLRQ